MDQPDIPLSEIFPGLPPRVLDYLLDDQLAALKRIPSAGQRLVLIETIFDANLFATQAGKFTYELAAMGRPIATLGRGVADDGRPRVLFLMAGVGPLEELAGKLTHSPVSIRDASIPVVLAASPEVSRPIFADPVVSPDQQIDESFDKTLSGLRHLYITEFPERVERLKRRLSELDRDRSNGPAIEEIQRISHSIRGSAGMYGFHSLSDLGEVMEECLASLRLAARPMPDAFCPLCAAWISALADIIDSAAHGVNKSAKDYDVYHRLKVWMKGTGS